jgi:hypothetical protein
VHGDICKIGLEEIEKNRKREPENQDLQRGKLELFDMSNNSNSKYKNAK